MSTTIDNKVVEMRFDNQQFEKNAEKSISTLDRLKQALRFDKSSTKGLDDLKTSTKDFNLDSIGKTVDGISDKFNAMGVVGFTVMQRITNAAIDAAINMGRAFSMNGVTSGFDKYSSKMEAVQVMAINTGQSIDAINPILDKLQGYTDETSYSFQQMTAAMGQFTASGVDIMTAEDMVEGIANWAATAGVNSQAAARAFTNLSQAVANGSLVWKDAQTLNEMNMFTPDFRNKVLEVAEAMGALTREGDSLYATYYTLNGAAKQMEVTADNFTTTLSRSKWLTTDVLAQVLHEYADTTEEFGAKAYDAAYEAKTFSDAVGAVKDAISTGWSISFEQIFGNYEEAALLWTTVANVVTEVVWGIREGRNELLKGWNELGGRSLLLFSITEALGNIALVLRALKTGFDEAFPEITAERLKELTRQFHFFVRSLTPSYETFHTLANISRAFVATLQTVVNIFKECWSILSYYFLPGIQKIITTFGQVITLAAKVVAVLIQLAYESGIVADVVDTVAFAFTSLISIAGKIVLSILDVVAAFAELSSVQRIINGAIKVFKTFGRIVGTAIGVVAFAIQNLLIQLSNLRGSRLAPYFDGIEKALNKFYDTVVKAKNALVSFITAGKPVASVSAIVAGAMFKLANGVKVAVNAIIELIKAFRELPIVQRISKSVGDALTKFAGATLYAFGAIITKIGQFIESIRGIKKEDIVKHLSGVSKGLEFLWGIVTKITGAVGGLFAMIADKLGILKDVDEAVEETAKATIVLDDSVTEIASTVTRAGETIGEASDAVEEGAKKFSIFSKIGEIFGSFSGKATELGTTLGEFFSKLSAGQVIAIAFGGAVAWSVMKIASVFTTIPVLLGSVTSTFWGLSRAIQNWSIWGNDTVGDTSIKIAKSIAILAGSLVVLTLVDSTKLHNVAEELKFFLLVMGGVLASGIGLIIAGAVGELWTFGLSIMALAIALTFLAGSVKILQGIDIEKIVMEIGALVGGILTLVYGLQFISTKLTAISIATKKIAKPGELDVTKLALSIIALGLSVALIVHAISRLASLPKDQIGAAGAAAVTTMIVFAGVLKAASSLGTLAKGAGVGMLAAAASIHVLVGALDKIVNNTVVMEIAAKTPLGIVYLQRIGVMIGAIGALMLLTRAAGPNAMGAGIAALSIALAMDALLGALVLIAKAMQNLSAEQMLAAAGVLVAIGGALALIVGVMGAIAISGAGGTVGKDVAKIAVSLLACVLSITLLAVAVAALSFVPWQNLLIAGAVLAALTVAMGFMISFLKVANGMSVVSTGPILAMILAIGAIIAGIALLGGLAVTNADAVMVGALAMLGGLVGLAVVLKSLADVTGTINIAPILAMVAAIAAIGASLYFISTRDVEKIGAAAAGMLIALVGMAIAMSSVSGIAAGINIAPILVMVGAIATIGYSLYQLAAFDWTSLVAAGIGIGIVLGALVAALRFLKGGDLLAAGSLIALSLGVVALARAMQMLQGIKWEEIKGGLAGAGLALAAMMAAALVAGSDPLISLGLIAIASAFAILGASAIEFAYAAKIVANAILTFTNALTVLGSIGPPMAENIKNTLISLGQGIGAGLASIVTSFWGTLLEAIFAGVSKVGETIIGFVGKFIEWGGIIVDAFVQGFRNKLPSWAVSAYDGITGIINAIRSRKQDMTNSMEDTVDGINDGVTKSLSKVRDNGEKLGDSFVEGYRDGAMWHSRPKWEDWFFGDLESGIEELTPSACSVGAENGAAIGEAVGSAAYGHLETWGTKFKNLMASLGSMASGLFSDGVGDAEKEAAEADAEAYKETKSFISDANRALVDQNKWRKQTEQKRTQEKMTWNAYNMRNNPAKDDGISTPPGGGGGGGGGSSKATKEVKELFDVMKDGKEIIEKHVELFGDLHEKLGFTQPMDLAKDAVQKLAESIYAASVKTIDAETQAAKSTEDKLAEMKEAFDAFVSDVGTAVTNQVDVWGSLTYAQATATKDWEKNFNTQTKLVNEWHRSLIMIARRVSPEFLQEIAKMGPEATLQILEWASLTDEGLAKVEERYLNHGEYVTDVIETTMAICAQSAEGMTGVADEWVKSFGVAVEYFGDVANEASTTATAVVQANKKMGDSAIAYARITDQMAAKAAKSYLEVKEQVADTLRSQIDLFTKFEEKDDEDHQTIDDMNEAAESNLHAMQKWAGLMTQLQAKGASDGLLQKFYEGGINMMAELEEVVNASEVQFNELNSYFTQFETAIDDVAKKVGMGAANAAIMFSDGFMNNIKTDADTEAVRKMVQNFVDALIGQIEDPSAGVVPVGTKVDEGVSQGITEGTDQVENAATQTMTETTTAADEAGKTGAHDIAYNLDSTLATFIREYGYMPVNAAGEVAQDVLDAYKGPLEIESPSKAMIEVGRFLDLGLAKGIEDNANLPVDSSGNLVSRVSESIHAIVDHIASIINGEVNVDPTIRPVLDTSNIEAGASSIDSMLGGRAYSLSRGVDIQNNSDSIRDLIAQTMAEMRANNPQPAYAGPPINMYVYGAEGQSEEEIANIVEAKLMHRINVRGGTWR